MYIENIELKNFRNYDVLSLNLNNSLNVFVGENAQGKTNILESIYFLSSLRSHRTNKDKEMIKWGASNAYAGIRLIKNTGKCTIEALLDNNERTKFKINGLKTNKSSEVIGILNTVIFSPEDLRLIKDSPSIRRRFIDNELCQIKKGYCHNLNQYNRVLLQRNNLLKNSRVDRELALVYGEQLSHYGSLISFERLNFIKRLSMIARLIHRRITDGSEELELNYESSAGPFKYRDEIKENLIKCYNESNEDFIRGITLKGPHRDDFQVKINGNDARSYASQGQQRTSALSLKLSELEIIKGECGEYPVLLLDDVMSELDGKRQRFLLNVFKDIQTIITCTSIKDIEGYPFKEREINIVIDGKVNKTDNFNVNKNSF